MNNPKIAMQSLEVNIVYSCNLKCEYCTHLGKYMKGCVSLDEIVLWYAAWHEKVHPELFTLLGGEPLLHPNLTEVLYATKEYWHNSEIQMVTNGLLLPTVPESVWEALRKANILVSISKHSIRPEFEQKLSLGIQCLEQRGIRCEIRPSYTWWMKSHRLDESGRILPYCSDPEKAWKNCFVKHNCMTLMDGMIFRCPQIACFTHAYNTGLLSEDWSFLREYRPLSPVASDVEIMEFLHKQAEPECRLCPEAFEYTTENEKLPLLENLL